MKEYLNKIICGDCLNVLKVMPEKSVKLVITSPPYNVKTNCTSYGIRYDVYIDNLKNDEYKTKMFEIIKECIRISDYVFWNMQMLNSTKEFIIDLLFEFRKNFKDIFIWHKNAMPNSGNKKHKYKIMSGAFEFVFIFGEDNSRDFQKANFPKNNFVPNLKYWHKKEMFENHHATFPLELPLYFIRFFSKKNDIILDPFVGTGTTCVAAKKLHRRYIGIDISPNYCKLAEKRIQNINPELFDLEDYYFMEQKKIFL